MRAELQRWSSWVPCKGRKSREESGKKIRGRVKEGKRQSESSRSKSTGVESGLHPGCRARETLSIFIPWGSVHRRYLRRHWRILRAIVTKTTTSKDNSAS
ncbi:hypothetical protein ACS0PU_010091 [Formica fusca]